MKTVEKNGDKNWCNSTTNLCVQSFTLKHSWVEIKLPTMI